MFGKTVRFGELQQFLEQTIADFEHNKNVEMDIFKDNIKQNVRENVRERLIKDLILTDNQISIIEMAKRLSVNEKTIRRDLQKMREHGVLRRIGADKGGHWEVLENKQHFR